MARLAGLPDQVVIRAKQILSSLENGQRESQHKNDISDKEKEQTQDPTEEEIPNYAEPKKVVTVRQKAVDPSQLELF